MTDNRMAFPASELSRNKIAIVQIKKKRKPIQNNSETLKIDIK